MTPYESTHEDGPEGRRREQRASVRVNLVNNVLLLDGVVGDVEGHVHLGGVEGAQVLAPGAERRVERKGGRAEQYRARMGGEGKESSTRTKSALREHIPPIDIWLEHFGLTVGCIIHAARSAWHKTLSFGGHRTGRQAGRTSSGMEKSMSTRL